MALVRRYKEIFDKYKAKPIPTLEEQLSGRFKAFFLSSLFNIHFRSLTQVVLVGKTEALFNNRIENIQCIALLEVLKSVSTLELLDLSYNHIDNGACAAIAEFVEV